MNRHERIRAGGNVRRYHTRHTIGHQTVAEHSWGVAAIICEIVPNPSAELLKAAIYHDVAEFETGDIPAQAKRALRSVDPNALAAFETMENNVEKELGIAPDLTEDESIALKTADLLELLHYCLDQRRLGNVTLHDVWCRGCTYLNEMIARMPTLAIAMLSRLKDQYDYMNQAIYMSPLPLPSKDHTHG